MRIDRDTIAELHWRGLDLTPNEIDVFVHADARVWRGKGVGGEA